MLRINHCAYFITSVSKFHTSSITYLNQRWRRMNGLVTNPNTASPLLNLPDYSFKDNKPTPYTARQLKRIKRHQEYAKKIIQLVKEVDYAVERHAMLMKEKENQKLQILNSKLKPKGQQSITSK